MKYYRKITFATMTVIIMVFIFSNRHYVFNKQNEFGGLLFIPTTLKIWHEKSPADYNFCPVLTYPNSGDKFITYYKRLEDKEGNNYYVSSPPFPYILAYITVAVLQLPVNVSSIRLIGFALLILSSLIIYFIMNLLSGKKILEYTMPAVIAMIVFLFTPVNICGSTYAFLPEIFIWLVCIFFFLYIIHTRSCNYYMIILYGFSVFLLNYTEWIGLFFSFSVIVYCAFKFRDKFFLRISVITLLVTISSLLLTFIQFSTINNTAELFHSMKIRFLERSGLFGEYYSALGINIFSISSWSQFLININSSLSGFGYLMTFLVIAYILQKRNFRILKNFNSAFFYTTILPVLIHFLIFFNSNAIHRIQSAKLIIPVSLITGYMVSYFFYHSSSKIIKILLISAFTFAVLFSHHILLKNFIQKYDMSVPAVQGIYIQNNALPAEAVFIGKNTASEFSADYYLTFLSNRNLRYADGKDDAVVIAQQFGKTKGVYFELNADTSQCKAFHFKVENNEDSQ
ncbi:MAG: hypothetical protein V1904_11525 [Bacteroidota bacterium]